MTTFLPSISRKFTCSISGTEEEGDSFYESEEKDGLFDLPLGWTAIAIKRRVSNPKYRLLMQMRELLIADMLTRAGKNVTPAQGAAIELQVEAQFAALVKDTPPHITEHEVAFVAPIERSDEMLLEVYNELRTTLGLPLLTAEGTVDDDDDDDDDDEADETSDEGAAQVNLANGSTTAQNSLTATTDETEDEDEDEDEDEAEEDLDSDGSLTGM